MTATPIEEEFMLVELKELPILEVIWSNRRKVTVVRQPVSSPQRYVSELITKKLEDKSFGNLHFFVNSVKVISNILKRTNINSVDVKVVCADNPYNDRKLGAYKIKKPSDKACKINFYTSTCFEGCDIFDKEGKTYVVSEGRNPNTLYDISTLFIQIIGRIRDSKYGNEVYHIHSSSSYAGDVSYDEFKGIADREYRVSASCINEYNSEPVHLKKMRVEKWSKEHFENRFIYVNEEYTFELDRNLLNKSLLDYKLKSEVYNKSTYLIQSYKENGLNVRSSEYIKYSDKLKANTSTKGNFKEAIEEYYLLATSQN
ncbi:hypothetical protein CLV62_10314 [Dysgonomonas alginatilytica]|uniref:Uncharacterized protein n=1 Tax=Dysgonomonas alginatilytica TaxID=1605892 RepID=A0A2V3PYU3_9BACT|nr:hypothetical protein [Dysgonomonas alginatilytica]PXV67341.1 hypothetical protein CLV62_10314 [Dysgonomonas alginatilytica]